ncbi:prepilin peptidase [bacterium]|nr:prepilin peptidase [candidate division CSSED10-310 bacterium]
MMWSIYIIGCCFLFGLVIGSFLNVVIYRIPRDLSIIRPPSSCPTCHRLIKPWENIPILSYVFILRGHCAGCGSPISLQYPVVEAFTGILFALVGWRFGGSFQTLVFIAFTAILIVLSVIDLQTRLLPDVIVLPGLLTACLLAVMTLHPKGAACWSTTVSKAFFGMAAGGLPLLLLAWGYLKLTGREGMGGGDIKLMFFIGALLGPGKVLLTLFIGSLVGAVAGSIALKLAHGDRHTQIPFGPFLSGAAWISMMWGDGIIRSYLMFSDLAG